MFYNKTEIIAFLTLLVCLASSCTNVEHSTNNNLRTSVEVSLKPSFVPNDEPGSKLWDSTKQLYTLRQFQPAWSTQDGVSPGADAAVQTLENASREGLHPQDFGVAELRTLRDSLKASTDVAARDEFELRLSYALMHYATQLCLGRINPTGVSPDWPATKKECEIARLVNESLEQNSVENLAEQLSPRIPEYQALKTSLARYREVASQGGWQSLQLPASKGRKAALPADPALRTRLALSGDLPAAAGEGASAVNVQELTEGLKRFQLRHGLDPDGRLGEKTVAALNVPVEQRIEQIEINLDRMRWIADGFEPRHIRVNIPGFQLTVHDGEEVPLQMRAIVGSKENPTPVLDGAMEYLVFSPYWNIPLSIATKEFLPKIQKDPKYLERENIEVVRVLKERTDVIDPSRIKWDKESDLSGYQLRQKPGATNALGLVKFIFPNSYSVYLHDTPSDNLFDRLTRTLSHGCVRLERPVELAAYVLKDQPEWTPERIDEAMHAEKEKHVPLKTPLPIHLFYWTAWTDSEGNAQFREDVYGFDEKQRELTKSNEPALPAANTPNVNMHEIGTGVVPDAAGLHREGRLSK